MRKMKYWVLGLAMSVSLLVGAVDRHLLRDVRSCKRDNRGSYRKRDCRSSPDTKGGSCPDWKQRAFDLSAIPAYSGQPYVAVNNNVPSFPTQI